MPFWYKINHYFESVAPYPEMLDAIQCIQAEGIKTALLTNNWKFYPHNSCPPVDYVRHFFDVVSYHSFLSIVASRNIFIIVHLSHCFCFMLYLID